MTCFKTSKLWVEDYHFKVSSLYNMSISTKPKCVYLTFFKKGHKKL